MEVGVRAGAWWLTFLSPTRTGLCRLSFVFCPLIPGFPRQTLDTAKGSGLNRRWESLKLEDGAKHFRDSTGGWADFASPAGRVRGRRRAAPSAFVVAAADRQVAAGRAGTTPVRAWRGQPPAGCPRILTNLHEFYRIREIRVNSWTANWRFARTRNGAGRRSRKPACAGRESVRAARRDTKTLRPVLEWMEQVGRSKE